jgi:hypothetical protein
VNDDKYPSLLIWVMVKSNAPTAFQSSDSTPTTQMCQGVFTSGVVMSAMTYASSDSIA